MIFKKLVSIILSVSFCFNNFNYIVFAQNDTTSVAEENLHEYEQKNTDENVKDDEQKNTNKTVKNDTMKIDARGAVLVEPKTGKILIEQNKDEQYPLASVTKIMTLILIYDAIEREQIKWEDIVTTSLHAASMGGSQVYLEENEQQSVETLTKCIAIASAKENDIIGLSKILYKIRIFT